MRLTFLETGIVSLCLFYRLCMGCFKSNLTSKKGKRVITGEENNTRRQSNKRAFRGKVEHYSFYECPIVCYYSICKVLSVVYMCSGRLEQIK